MTVRSRIQVHPKLCRDCQACALACSLLHEGHCSLSSARVRVLKDMAKYEFHILICQHCESPACLDACPSAAMEMDDRGVVLIADEACTRCGECAASCPHDAIFLDGAQNRYLKCELCAGRPDGPLCVEVCPVGALAMVKGERDVETA